MHANHIIFTTIFSIQIYSFCCQDHLPTNSKCFGYEKNCDKTNFDYKCDQKSEEFFSEADFGYVQRRIKSMKTICKAKSKIGGTLKCSDQLQFCSGKNIWIDFRDMKIREKEIIRYNKDVLKMGQIAAKCELDEKMLKNEIVHDGPLQSWANEIANFKTFDQNQVLTCDLRINKPTIFLKLDATVNMYHHFCDFFNLYASLHINGSDFSRDINILSKAFFHLK